MIQGITQQVGAKMSEEKTVVLSKEDIEAIKKGAAEEHESEQKDEAEAKKSKEN
jgi:hypothetical protein